MMGKRFDVLCEVGDDGLEAFMRKHPRSEWKSLRIDYHLPFVDRLWMQYDEETRLFLHRIYGSTNTTKEEDFLFHPHPWPSTVVVVSEHGYDMTIGSSATLEPPPVLAKVALRKGCIYEMQDPAGWHAVMPMRNRSVYSIMITGKPWPKELRPIPVEPAHPLQPLSTVDEDLLFEIFHELLSSR